MEPPFGHRQVLLHIMKTYVKYPCSVRYGFKSLDFHLDDLCDLCSNYYCEPCEKNYKCGHGCVEVCPEIPCLDCTVFSIRKFLNWEVKGTVGEIPRSL